VERREDDKEQRVIEKMVIEECMMGKGGCWEYLAFYK